jgi:hypothetical protein
MKLDELQRLCDQATPGPWDGNTLRGIIDLQYAPAGHCTGMTWLSHDANFIAAARTALPKLIAVAKAAKLIAYPRGFRDGNVPDDLHRSLAALEAP